MKRDTSAKRSTSPPRGALPRTCPAAEHAVKTAHEQPGCLQHRIRILVEADDEEMPLRSGHGYEGPSILKTLRTKLRTKTPWLQDISSNVRAPPPHSPHRIRPRLETQRMNGRKLAKASDLRENRQDALQETARLRRADPAEYRRTRKRTLKSVRDMRGTARKLTAEVEKYARRNRDPLQMMRQRKNAERRQQLTFPLIDGNIRVLDEAAPNSECTVSATSSSSNRCPTAWSPCR